MSATKSKTNLSQIVLEDMSFYAYHGCFAEEQSIGTHFLCTVTMNTDISHAQQSDNIAHTINYLEAYQCIKKEFETPSHLLEHVAWLIAQRLLQNFSSLDSVQVKVSKLNPPLGGQLGAVSVTLCCKQNALATPPTNKK
jgi:dihydroneopterin aldolase